MNHFYRFLFVGAALFLLLGLCEKQTGDIDLSQSNRIDVQTETVHEGILPLSDQESEHFGAGGSLFKTLYDRAAPSENKVIASIQNATQYILLIYRFHQYRSKLMDGTGQLLHLPHSKEVPAVF